MIFRYALKVIAVAVCENSERKAIRITTVEKTIKGYKSRDLIA